MPKTPVIASMAARRPMTPRAAVAMRGGKRARESLSGQIRRVTGNAGIDAGEHAVQRGRYISGGQIGTHDQHGICLVSLRKREEHRRTGIFGQHFVLAVLDDSDDLIAALIAAEEMSADGRLSIAKHFSGEELIDDRNIRAFWASRPR